MVPDSPLQVKKDEVTFFWIKTLELDTAKQVISSLYAFAEACCAWQVGAWAGEATPPGGSGG